MQSATAVRGFLAGLESELDEVGVGAASDSQVGVEHLGDYLPGIVTACRSGRRVPNSVRDSTRVMGESAAEGGVRLGALVDLYLSATWRLWAAIAGRLDGVDPAVVASLATMVMRAADDTVAVLTDGYASAQRRSMRREEALRHEFVHDLLSGGSDPDVLTERAARFGLNLPGEHVVFVARTRRLLEDAGPVHGRVEALVLAALGGRDVLVATRDGMLVCAFPSSVDLVGALVQTLDSSGDGPWQIGVGGTHRGPGGLLRSYHEALRAIELARRASRTDAVAYFDDLLPVRVLTSDPGVAGTLVLTVLGPLEQARGGAEPLVETLTAFFEHGGNVEAAARRLNLSSRAVRYRLDRITALTGRSVFEHEDRFVLELALRCRALLRASPAEGSLDG